MFRSTRRFTCRLGIHEIRPAAERLQCVEKLREIDWRELASLVSGMMPPKRIAEEMGQLRLAATKRVHVELAVCCLFGQAVDS